MTATAGESSRGDRVRKALDEVRRDRSIPMSWVKLNPLDVELVELDGTFTEDDLIALAKAMRTL